MSMFSVSKPMRWLPAAALVALAAAVGPAQAANLDQALLDNSPKILAYLNKEGYKNVGVLPFKVKKGTRPASYTGGPLASTLPGRLENALIVCQSSNELRAIGVIRDAAGAASTQKVGAWARTGASYKALFTTQYPLAWGTRRVRPDAFLTGVINNTGNRATTTIDVQVIDLESRESGMIKARDVLRITVKTDRSLLRDLGYSYALARSSLRKGVTSRDRDSLAVEQVDEEERQVQRADDDRPGEGDPQKLPKPKQPKPKQQGQTQAVTPNNIAGMAFEIRYDGSAQTIRPMAGRTQGQRSREWQVDPARQGMTVTMALIRVLGEDRRLGVVLKVNGQSTWRLENAESIACKKWLYDLGRKDKEDIVEGFYMDTTGKNLQKFQVMSLEESATRAAELGDRAGWIDIDVYASGGGTQTQETDREEANIQTRALSRSLRRPKTLAELQKQLASANSIRLKPSKWAKERGLIMQEAEPSGEVAIDTDELPNPVHLGGISIKYWDRTNDQGRKIQDQ